MAGFLRPGAPGSTSENNATGKREMNDKFASKRERKIRRGRGERGREGEEIHVTGCLLERTAAYRRCSRGRFENRITNYTETRASPLPIEPRGVQFSQICSLNGLYSLCPNDQPLGTLETLSFTTLELPAIKTKKKISTGGVRSSRTFYEKNVI